MPPTDAIPAWLSAPPHSISQNITRLNANCGMKPPEPASRDEAELIVRPEFGFVTELGVARQKYPDED